YGLFRIERDAIPDRDNRVEHGTLAPREWSGKCPWICHRLSTPDELHTICFIGNFATRCTLGNHEMKHPWSVFGGGARTAAAENRASLPQDLRLNKQIAESRMQCVSCR